MTIRRFVPPVFAMAFCVSQALIATGASVTQKAWAITSLEQRHWRKRSHVPELPHPEILHPGMLTPLPQSRWRRKNRVPPLPYPELLHPRDNPPLSSGFVMTVTSPRHREAAAAHATVERPRDVAERLAACWTPPQSRANDSREITLRLQFAKNGSVIGEPRVTYIKPGPGEGAREAMVKSIRSALAECTPLRFTGRLGAGIAGYPFAIRFVAAGPDQ